MLPAPRTNRSGSRRPPSPTVRDLLPGGAHRGTHAPRRPGEMTMGPQGSIFVGKTLDEAVRKGLEALGLSRAEAMITMLEEGSGGFLGLGARPYKVRIVPRPGGAP